MKIYIFPDRGTKLCKAHWPDGILDKYVEMVQHGASNGIVVMPCGCAFPVIEADEQPTERSLAKNWREIGAHDSLNSPGYSLDKSIAWQDGRKYNEAWRKADNNLGWSVYGKQTNPVFDESEYRAGWLEARENIREAMQDLGLQRIDPLWPVAKEE